jgi:hypothetical protein
MFCLLPLYLSGSNDSCDGKKTMDLHVLPNLAFATIVPSSFDQWSGYFALVINYFNELWTPMHVTIGLFEMHDTTRIFTDK